MLIVNYCNEYYILEIVNISVDRDSLSLLIIRGPKGSKLFEGYLLNYKYFVINCRRGNAYLNNLDLVTHGHPSSPLSSFWQDQAFKNQPFQ